MDERTLIVVPTYNERENVEALASAIHEHVPTADLLIVDDASPDGTGELAEQMSAKDARVRVLRRPGKLGLGTAYRDGFARALADSYSFVVQMDADFSHDPADVPRLLEAARSDADIVIGSRWVSGGGTRNWGIGRRALSWGGSFYARTILGVAVRDLTSGFKCWRRSALQAVDAASVRSEGYAFQIEMTHRAIRRGFRILEIPIIFFDRRVGQSKMSSVIVREALLGVWKMRGRR